MAPQDSNDSAAPRSMGSPDHSRSGRDVEEGIERAEEGSDVEGIHNLEGQAPTGESRLEHMADVDETTEGRVDREGEPLPPPPRGPEPQDVGSGGAQRIVGARIPDRTAAGEPTPDGPPFDGESKTS
jgi:hypothetical protein